MRNNGSTRVSAWVYQFLHAGLHLFICFYSLILPETFQYEPHVAIYWWTWTPLLRNCKLGVIHDSSIFFSALCVVYCTFQGTITTAVDIDSSDTTRIITTYTTRTTPAVTTTNITPLSTQSGILQGSYTARRIMYVTHVFKILGLIAVLRT